MAGDLTKLVHTASTKAKTLLLWNNIDRAGDSSP